MKKLIKKYRPKANKLYNIVDRRNLDLCAKLLLSSNSYLAEYIDTDTRSFWFSHSTCASNQMYRSTSFFKKICYYTGRSNGVTSYNCSRIKFKELVWSGQITGLRRHSW